MLTQRETVVQAIDRDAALRSPVATAKERARLHHLVEGIGGVDFVDNQILIFRPSDLQDDTTEPWL